MEFSRLSFITYAYLALSNLKKCFSKTVSEIYCIEESLKNVDGESLKMHAYVVSQLSVI